MDEDLSTWNWGDDSVAGEHAHQLAALWEPQLGKRARAAPGSPSVEERFQTTTCPNGKIERMMQGARMDSVWRLNQFGWAAVAGEQSLDGWEEQCASAKRIRKGVDHSCKTPPTTRKLVVIKEEDSAESTSLSSSEEPEPRAPPAAKGAPLSKKVDPSSPKASKIKIGTCSRTKQLATLVKSEDTDAWSLPAARTPAWDAPTIKAEDSKEAKFCPIPSGKDAHMTRAVSSLKHESAWPSKQPAEKLKCEPEDSPVDGDESIKAEGTFFPAPTPSLDHTEHGDSGVRVKLEQNVDDGEATTEEDEPEELDELPHDDMMQIFDCVASSKEGQWLLKLAVNNNTRREEHVKFSGNILSVAEVYRKQVFARLLYDPQMKGIHNRSRQCKLPSRPGMPPTLEALVSDGKIDGLTEMSMALADCTGPGGSGRCHWSVQLKLHGRKLRWKTSACSFCASNFSRFMHETAKYAEWRLITKKTRAGKVNWRELEGWTLCEPCYGRFRNHGTLTNQSRPHHSTANEAHVIPWHLTQKYLDSPSHVSAASLSPSHVSPARSEQLPSCFGSPAHSSPAYLASPSFLCAPATHLSPAYQISPAWSASFEAPPQQTIYASLLPPSPPPPPRDASNPPQWTPMYSELALFGSQEC